MQKAYLTQENQLLYAKILHDLSAPLGALTLCIDDIKKALPEASELIEESIETLSQRIRYWRLMLTGSEQYPTFSEAIDIISATAKLQSVNITFANDEDYQGIYTRLILALALVCLEGLPRGGEIFINADTGILIASGEKCYISKDFQDVISNAAENITSRNALGIFVSALAKACSASLKIEHIPTKLTLTLQKCEN